MFIKVKAIKEERIYEIRKIKEKIINTDTIVTIKCITENQKYKFEGKETDVTEVEFINGKILGIIGKVDVDENSKLIITE